MKNKKAIAKSFTIFLAILVFALPLFVYSAGLVPCDGTPGDECNFQKLIILVDTVIDQIIFWSIAAVAPLLFMYAGFLLITSGGSTGKRDRAKDVFKKTVIGLLIMLSAWLIVNTLIKSFIAPGVNIDTHLTEKPR